MGDYSIMYGTKTGMIRVKGPTDVPEGHHYAVIILLLKEQSPSCQVTKGLR